MKAAALTDGQKTERTANVSWQVKRKIEKHKKKIDGQCQLREIVKTLCGRVYILYFLPNRSRQFYIVYKKLFKEELC